MSNSKALLAIDIGSEKIKIAQGYYRKEVLYIEKTGQLAVPEYSLEKGHIKNAKAVADEILNYLNNQNIKTKDVVLTFNAVGSVIRDIDMPKSNPKELDSMIKNEMIHTYHAGETNVIQYKLINVFKDDNGIPFEKYRVAALNSEIVEEYHDLVKRMKLNPVAMDINLNCIDKLFNKCKSINDQPITDKTTMLVDFGSQNTTVYINSIGKQQVFRHLNIGSAEIEKIVSGEMLTSPAVIKKMKEEGFNFLSSEYENEKYYLVLKSYFYNLNEELRNIVRFYTNIFESDTVNQIYVMGGGSSLTGLTEYLQAGLNIPVDRIQKMINVNDKNSKNDLHTYLNAFGALIRC